MTRPPPLKALAAALCGLLMACAAPAWADVNRDDAAAVAQRVTSGRVLAIERAGPVWRVKVLTEQGEVRIILVDAASGRVVG